MTHCALFQCPCSYGADGICTECGDSMKCSMPNCVDGYIPTQPDGEPGPCHICHPGSRGEPLVSEELADALADAGDPGVQIVLNAAVARGDSKVVSYCMQLINARLREQGKEV